MAVILVDFENVNATNGLRGVEYLNERDTLYIFYSGHCGKIRSDQIEAIERSGCTFKSFKLKNTGKNALDFYIAVECGILYEKGIRHVSIISKDKGFLAVRDYLQIRDCKMNVAAAPDIERGLISVNDPSDEARRQLIKSRSQNVDIQEMQARIEERSKFRKKLQEALDMEGIGNMYDHVLAYIEDSHESSPKEVYTGSLHKFGRDNGCKIYRILKRVS